MSELDGSNDAQWQSSFLITRRWPAAHPERIQLYSYPTPNGVKASIALEELQLPYEVHRVTISDVDVKSPEFLSLNPNNKIPAIIDPNGPGGRPLGLFESGVILSYLADKAGKLFGANEAERYEILQWLFFQVGGIGPMIGQFGFFYSFGGKSVQDPLPLERYTNETKRLLGVIDGHLKDREWMVGDFSIADIAIAPWIDSIGKFYKAEDVIGLQEYSNVSAFLERFNARPAVARGWAIPQR